MNKKFNLKNRAPVLIGLLILLFLSLSILGLILIRNKPQTTQSKAKETTTRLTTSNQNKPVVEIVDVDGKQALSYKGKIVANFNGGEDIDGVREITDAKTGKKMAIAAYHWYEGDHYTPSYPGSAEVNDTSIRKDAFVIADLTQNPKYYNLPENVQFSRQIIVINGIPAIFGEYDRGSTADNYYYTKDNLYYWNPATNKFDTIDYGQYSYTSMIGFLPQENALIVYKEGDTSTQIDIINFSTKKIESTFETFAAGIRQLDNKLVSLNSKGKLTIIEKNSKGVWEVEETMKHQVDLSLIRIFQYPVGIQFTPDGKNFILEGYVYGKELENTEKRWGDYYSAYDNNILIVGEPNGVIHLLSEIGNYHAEFDEPYTLYGYYYPYNTYNNTNAVIENGRITVKRYNYEKDEIESLSYDLKPKNGLITGEVVLCAQTPTVDANDVVTVPGIDGRKWTVKGTPQSGLPVKKAIAKMAEYNKTKFGGKDMFFFRWSYDANLGGVNIGLKDGNQGINEKPYGYLLTDVVTKQIQ